MKPRLKEDPKEWRNFALLCCGMLLLFSGLALWKKWIGGQVYSLIVSVVTIAAVVALIQPESFRGLYRGAMTVSFHIGQVMGKVILSIFYLVAVTPLGLLLRLFGKELLELKSGKAKSSYWKPARKPGNFDQQF